MTLVVAIGGVRSGKSAWAEHQARELAGGLDVTVLATADPDDRSMTDRIGRHMARRSPTWPVVEVHGLDDIASALPTGGVALFDGIGGWVAGMLDRGGAFVDDAAAARAATRVVSEQAHAAIQRLIEAVAEPGRALVVASEETGLGVVPLGAGTAAWVDLVGELNQRFVSAADLAVVVVAGRALPLTDAAVPLTRADATPSLSVISTTAPGGRPVDDSGERRAHPRLVGAGSPRPVPAEPAENERPPMPIPPGIPAIPPPPLPTPTPVPPAPESPTTTEGAAIDVAALRRHGDRLVRPGDADHAVNVVADGPPAWLRAAFEQAIDADLTRYPDAAEAEAVLAGVYGRGPGEIVATNGAAEALWLLPAALRPKHAVVLHPLFTEAEAALHAHGVAVTRVLREPHADFAVDASEVPDDADLVIVSNPAAGSGTLATRATILALRQPGRTIVVDEAFMDLVPGETESLAGYASDDVIVVRSFTKSLSIPGIRCGAAIAPAALAARLRAVQPPWSVNALAVAGLVALGAHPGELPARAQQAAEERTHLAVALAALPGVRVWPSSTNHVLIEVAGGARVAAALSARQIAVRPCGTFPGLTDDHLRITARNTAANDALVAALGDILGERSPA